MRLFLALWPDAAIRRRIAAHAGAWSLPADRGRMSPEDWHVTLHYIGSVAADRVPAVADALEVSCEPFELVLDRPTLWPRGLAVVEASTVPPALESLHGALAEALLAQGLPVEQRRFRPHLTLARNAGRVRPPRDPDPIGWPAHGYRLVVSTGRPEQRYAPLREYRAGRRPNDPGP